METLRVSDNEGFKPELSSGTVSFRAVNENVPFAVANPLDGERIQEIWWWVEAFWHQHAQGVWLRDRVRSARLVGFFVDDPVIRTVIDAVVAVEIIPA